MTKKAIVFDMDECIGSFWSLWPLYQMYKKNIITDYNKLQIIAGKTILPTCLRPNLFYLLSFLEILKRNGKINNIFLYTNNGNYFTVRDKPKDKDSFPNFIINCIEKYYKLPGIFDLVMETVFIRTRDAKNHIKEKFIDDLKPHGYDNKSSVLIFDDNRDVWRSGTGRVIRVKQFRGASHCFTKKNLDLLSKEIIKIVKEKSGKYSNHDTVYNYLVDFFKNEKDKTFTEMGDKEINIKFFPAVIDFCL